MPKFLDYNPEQVYLLPPSVRDVLGENHVCFFLHRAVEALELNAFEQGYADDGRPAYHPALMLKVWLYARSEEHTSELQSLAYLVCRLLLEKKKTECALIAQKARLGSRVSERNPSPPITTLTLTSKHALRPRLLTPA